jgi:hypothetical protein
MGKRTIFIALCIVFGLSCSREEPASSQTQPAAEPGQTATTEKSKEVPPDQPTKVRPAPSGGYSGAIITAHRKAKDTAALISIRNTIQSFHAMNERYPKDLEELRSNGYEIPEPPSRMAYQYNPETGEINLTYTGP